MMKIQSRRIVSIILALVLVCSALAVFAPAAYAAPIGINVADWDDTTDYTEGDYNVFVYYSPLYEVYAYRKISDGTTKIYTTTPTVIGIDETIAIYSAYTRQKQWISSVVNDTYFSLSGLSADHYELGIPMIYVVPNGVNYFLSVGVDLYDSAGEKLKTYYGSSSDGASGTGDGNSQTRNFSVTFPTNVDGTDVAYFSPYACLMVNAYPSSQSAKLQARNFAVYRYVAKSSSGGDDSGDSTTEPTQTPSETVTSPTIDMSGIESGLDDVQDAIDDMSSDVQGAIDDMSSDVQSSIGDMSSEVQGAIGDMSSEVQGAIGDMSTEVNQGLDDVQTAVDGTNDRLDSIIGDGTEGDELETMSGLMGFQNQQIDDFNRSQQESIDSGLESVFDSLNLDSWQSFITPLSFIQHYIDKVFDGLGIYSIVYTLPLFLGLFFYMCSRIPGSTRVMRPSKVSSKSSGGDGT